RLVIDPPVLVGGDGRERDPVEAAIAQPRQHRSAERPLEAHRAQPPKRRRLQLLEDLVGARLARQLEGVEPLQVTVAPELLDFVAAQVLARQPRDRRLRAEAVEVVLRVGVPDEAAVKGSPEPAWPLLLAR